MAWTNARTWVAGELVTAAMMNTHLRDNLDFWASTPHELQVRRSSDQTISNATGTAISWNAEDRDVGFNFAPTASVITVQQSGIYTVSLTTQWAGDTGAQCGLEIRISGLATTARVGHGGICPIINEANQKNCTVTQRIEAGQTIECWVLQSSGASMALQSSSAAPAGTRLYIAQVSRTLGV